MRKQHLFCTCKISLRLNSSTQSPIALNLTQVMKGPLHLGIHDEGDPACAGNVGLFWVYLECWWLLWYLEIIICSAIQSCHFKHQLYTDGHSNPWELLLGNQSYLSDNNLLEASGDHWGMLQQDRWEWKFLKLIQTFPLNNFECLML